MALGGIAGLGGLFGNKQSSGSTNANITEEELHLEREIAASNLASMQQGYEWKLDNLKNLTDAFFDSYQRDVDNSFKLYKYSRDNYDTLNQRITDSSFGLYKSQRDEKDALNEKISALQSKVDVMQAVRPYQDALINAKIDNNALVSDFNLFKRTSRMIEGQLVLPSEPEVTGFTSYNPYIYQG